MRKINWATYRKMKRRAEAAEIRAQALDELLLRKTGMSSHMHGIVDLGEALANAPRANVRLINISAPAEA